MIALIISIMLSSLILLSYHNSKYTHTFMIKKQLRSNVNSGINILLGNKNIIELNTEKKISLFDEEESNNILLSRKQWGVYEIIRSKINNNYGNYYKMALTGDIIDSENALSLYLADLSKPLSLCGKTEINGICYLPKSGVKRAYIEGKSFSGKKLINGIKKESSKELPELPKTLKNINYNNLKSELLKTDSLITFFETLKINDTSVSFSNKTLILYSTETINLNNYSLIGNIIILSDKMIEVSKNSNLKDVIISAPFINIEQGFEGNLQAFSSDSINIEKNCNLSFPSCIGLFNNDISDFSSSINIGEQTTISGLTYLFKDNITRKNIPIINIGKNTIIKGQVYCNGMIQHKGKVWGSVYCNKFFLSTRSSIYENHLIDAVIDHSKLSTHYAGINIENKDANRKVIKWLY